MTDIPVDEDDSETIPLWDRIDRANIFVANDVHPNQEVQAKLQQGAERDLFAHRMLPDDSIENYRSFLEPKQEVEPAPLPREFVSEPKAYKSIFDRSE